MKNGLFLLGILVSTFGIQLQSWAENVACITDSQTGACYCSGTGSCVTGTMSTEEAHVKACCNSGIKVPPSPPVKPAKPAKSVKKSR